jgi:hypothetical protein
LIFETGTQQSIKFIALLMKSQLLSKINFGLFLDIGQAFDKVWHDDLLYKLKLLMPAPYYLIIKSYLQNRSFVVRWGNNISSTYPISAGVP